MYFLSPLIIRSMVSTSCWSISLVLAKNLSKIFHSERFFLHPWKIFLEYERFFSKIKLTDQHAVGSIALMIGVGCKHDSLARATFSGIYGFLFYLFGGISIFEKSFKNLSFWKIFWKNERFFERNLRNFEPGQTKKITSQHSHAWSRQLLFFARRQF